MLAARTVLTFSLWSAMQFSTALGGIILTADVYDTPGMPGFQTYDLTATSAGGFVNAFDFYDSAGRGITGSLHQGGDDWSRRDRLFGDLLAEPVDSHWLVGQEVGLSIGARQSSQGIHAAYTFTRVGGQKDKHRQLPFVRLVTDNPASVRIKGEFLVAERYTNRSLALRQPRVVEVDSTLLEVPVGGAPTIGAFDDPIGPTQAEIDTDPRAAWQAGWLRARADAAEARDHLRLDSLARHRQAVGLGTGEFDHDRWLVEQADLNRLANQQAIEEAQQAVRDRLQSADSEDEGSVVYPRPIGVDVTTIDSDRLTDTIMRDRLAAAVRLIGVDSVFRTTLTGLQPNETPIHYVGSEIAIRNTVGFQASDIDYSIHVLATTSIGSISASSLDLSSNIHRDLSVGVAQLHALNNGRQARVMIPEPATMGLAVLAVLSVAASRRIIP